MDADLPVFGRWLKDVMETKIDDSAYVSAVSLWKDKFDNYKAFKRFLDGHPEIRNRNPRKNRLVIHAGDWAKYWDKQHEQVFDALGEAATPKITSMFTDEVKTRYEGLHGEKQRQQPRRDTSIEALAKRIQAGK